VPQGELVIKAGMQETPIKHGPSTPSQGIGDLIPAAEMI